MPKETKYPIKIRDIPKVERPRERLEKVGAEALRKDELLALIFRTGFKGKNVLEVARSVLKRYPKDELIKVDYEELKKLRGVGPTRAAQLVAGFELAKRMLIEPEEKVIQTPEDVYKFVPEIRKARKEHFIAIYLNTRNVVIRKETISIGTLNANLVHPREVFQPAVEESAANVILVHNHPSGDPEPSEDDLEITKRLIESGKILGIEITDHIIVTNNRFFSFKEQKLI